MQAKLQYQEAKRSAELRDIAEALETGVDIEKACDRLGELIEEGDTMAIILYLNHRFGPPETYEELQRQYGPEMGRSLRN